MSFMDFLNESEVRVDDEIIKEEYIESIKEPKPIKKKSKKVKRKKRQIKESHHEVKSSSISDIEYRIKEKLNLVGLNDTIINEVVSYVLGDVYEIESHTKQSTQAIKHESPSTPQGSGVFEHASLLLDDPLFEDTSYEEPTLVYGNNNNIEEPTQLSVSDLDLSNTSDRANALLM